MEEKVDDANLIEGNEYTQVQKSQYTVYRYVLMKIIPLSIFVTLFLTKFYTTGKILMVLPLIIAEFWIEKNVDGLELIGMRWFYQTKDNGEEGLFYYARPDPYVPKEELYGLFWSFVYAFSFLWGFSTLICLIFYLDDYSNIYIGLIGTFCEVFNLISFKRCQNEWNKQTDQIARTIMLGDAFNSDNEENKNTEAEADVENNKETENDNENEESPEIVIDG